MSNSNNKIQYIIACLTTHSLWAAKILNNFSDIFKWFSLTSSEEMKIRSFIKSEGKRLYISALLMEEKRKREVFPTIKYATKLINQDYLKTYWANYVSSFGMTDHIPSTPILESVVFLKYLLDIKLKDMILNEIIKYEMMKNTTLAYEFTGNEKIGISDISMINLDFDAYRVYLNPSYSVIKFEFPVSRIIQTLKTIENESIHLDSFNKQDEEVAFFKNQRTGLVKTISIDASSKFILNKIYEIGQLKEFIENIKNFTLSYADSFVNTMLKNDLIRIVEVN